MSVYKSGCMGVLVYTRVGVWEYECIQEWVYGCMSVYKSGCMGVLVYTRVGVWEY